MMGGRFSKFQERLRNIRLSRRKKLQFQKENQKFIDSKVQEIKKVIQADGTVYRVRVAKGIGERKLPKKATREVVENPDKKEIDKVDLDIKEVSKEKLTVKDVDEQKKVYQDDSSHVVHVPSSLEKKSVSDRSSGDKPVESEDIKNKEVSKDDSNKDLKSQIENINLKKPKLPKKKVGYAYSTDPGERNKQLQSLSDSERKERIAILGAELTYKIKNQFENYLDEIDVLSSELYLLDEDLKKSVEVIELEQLNKKIYSLVERMNKIIDQYEAYRKNGYLDRVLDFDDSTIIDDMIDYRDLLDSAFERKKFATEYRMMDEFKLLYSHLVDIDNKEKDLQERTLEKKANYEERDSKFLEINEKMKEELNISLKCNQEINEQEQYLKDIMGKVGKITKEEYVTHVLKGLNQLVSTGLRYIGLMMCSPLRGLVPSIGLQALVTNQMLHSVYRNLRYEKVEHVKYSAINYDRELLDKISDIDFTSDLLEQNLYNIQHLKEDFLMQYQSNIPHYDEFLANLEKVEDKIIHQKNKVEIIKSKLEKSKKINEHKMKTLDKLNHE